MTHYLKALRNLDYWMEVTDIRRENTLVWTLTPNGKWPEGHSFGFHFSRDCLSFETKCRFRQIVGQSGYRLTFPRAITEPESHPHICEAALWTRLTAL